MQHQKGYEPHVRLGSAASKRTFAQGVSGCLVESDDTLGSARGAHSARSRRRVAQLIFVLLTSLATSSLVSHLLVDWIGIRPSGVGYKILGSNGEPPTAVAEGSSLMRDAISWQPVSHLIRATIENWFAAGSSPSEWEVLLQRATNPQRVFVAISLYDLNEESLCDSRAEIVPISQTVRDLISTNADWQFAKRLLTQYPVSFIRLVYPTVGRSDGVLVGLREKAARLMPSAAPALGAVEAPTIVSPDSEIGTVNTETEKLTDWSPARTLRRMALMRIAIKGVTRLDGPKKVSFIRMLRRAQASGQVDVLVLPVSESYRREFVSSEANARFEALLGLARSTAPTAHWYRLDRVPALNSDECYLDFVHLNNRGQEIATALFLQMLSTRDGEVTN